MALLNLQELSPYALLEQQDQQQQQQQDQQSSRSLLPPMPPLPLPANVVNGDDRLAALVNQILGDISDLELPPSTMIEQEEKGRKRAASKSATQLHPNASRPAATSGKQWITMLQPRKRRGRKRQSETSLDVLSQTARKKSVRFGSKRDSKTPSHAITQPELSATPAQTSATSAAASAKISTMTTLAPPPPPPTTTTTSIASAAISSSTSQLALNDLGAVMCPLGVVSDLFDVVVGPALSVSNSQLAQCLNQELMKKHFLMIVCHFLAQFAHVTPQHLYQVVVESLKYCGILPPNAS